MGIGKSNTMTTPLRTNSRINGGNKSSGWQSSQSQSQSQSQSPSSSQTLSLNSDPVACSLPPDKVIVDIGDLKKVNMSRLMDPSFREFVVLALFDTDDINEAMEKPRQRTKIVEGKFSLNVYSANFSSKQIILPMKEGAKFLRFYVSAISTEIQSDNEKTTKEVSLKGLGYTEGVPLQACKTHPWKTHSLITAAGGDPTTATVDVQVRCCKLSFGPEIPPDEIKNILEDYE